MAVSLFFRTLALTALFGALLSGRSAAAPQPRAALFFQGAPAVPNLMGYWALDETAIGTAADSSGNGNAGNHINNPTISTALPTMPNYACNQRSLSFNVASGQRVDVPDSATLSLTGSFTLAAWVRTTGAQANQQGIIEKFDGPSPYFNGYYIRLTTTLVVNFNIVLAGGGTQGFTTSPRAVAANTWTHVAGTYDQTTGQMSVYMNGALDPSSAVSTGPPGDGTSNLSIGASGSAQPFSGEVDEARVYSRALTQAEIQILMNGQPPATGLMQTPGPNQVTLTWTGATGATSYNVYRAPASTGPFAIVGSSTTTTFTDSGAVFPNTYYYRVTAVSVMESCPTAAVASTPQQAIPRTTGDNPEGFFGDRCECGTVGPAWPSVPLLLAAAAMLGLSLVRRRI